MAFSIQKFVKAILIRQENTLTPKEIEITPGGAAGTKTSVISSQTANRTLTLPDATDILVGESATQTLTNKTIDADLNTISNIENADIKTGAAIDAAKLADGSVSNTEFQYLNGITSAIQTQLDGKASTGSVTTVQNNLDNHINDTSDAHDASAISSVPAGNLSATDVQGALDELQGDIDNRIPSSEKGANNGVATLDSGGKVPASQLPSSVMDFKGNWNASTNSPTLADGVGDSGDVYRVNVAGTQNLGSGSQTFQVGDWVLYNGSIWQQSSNSAGVVSVNSQSGVVVLDTDDISEGSNLYFTNGRAQTALSGHTGASSGVHGVTGDVVGTTDFQTLSSKILSTIRGDVSTNSTTTGANATVSTTGYAVVRLTNSSLTSLSGIAAGSSGQLLVLENQTGSTISLLDNDSGASGGDRIRTGTGAPVSIANNATVLLTYDATATKWMLTSGSGSSSDLNNFVTNGTAESGTTGWLAYADAAGSSPVDGSGGSPTVTITSSNSSPLSGTSSFLLTKDAANRQGQGVSYDFVIDNARKSKVLQLSFDYIISSGTFTAGSSSSDSDVTIWIYDIGNNILIQPSTYKLYSNSSTTPNKFISNFQSSADSTTYRVIFHCATTSASAYVLKFDNVSVSPTAYSYGTPITDWVDGGPITISATTTAPTKPTGGGVVLDKAWWRRIGDSMEVRYEYRATGNTGAANGSGDYLWRIPGGYSIDTSKVYSGQNSVIGNGAQDYPAAIGMAAAGTPGSAAGKGNIRVYDSSYVRLFVDISSVGSGHLPIGTNGYFPIADTANKTYSAHFMVPILGWSAQVQSSDVNDQRIVAAKYVIPNSKTTSSSSPLDASTKVYDTHNAVTTGSSWKFTAPLPGIYLVTANAYFGGTTADIHVYKNGTVDSYVFTSISTTAGAGSTTVSLNAGDYIDLRSIASATSTAAVTNPSITIQRIANPASITTTESVASRYYASSTSVSGSLATVVWTTKDYDTHNSVSSGVFTCPVAGRYQVMSSILLSGTFALNNTMIVEIQKNGTVVSRNTQYAGGAVTNFKGMIQDIVSCNAGDTLRIQVSSSGTSPAIVSSNFDNYMTVQKVGL